MNKQLVLPFIPPKFSSNTEDCLIKPSEYLKSIGGTRPASSTNSANGTLVQKNFTKCLEHKLNHLEECKGNGVANGPPPPPLPGTTQKEEASVLDNSSTSKARKTQQPLSAISIHDLNSVQLRRTDKTVLQKTMSTPVKSSTSGMEF